MLTPANLFPYQRRAIQSVLEHKNAMLWIFMGGGKTASMETAILDLFDRGEITGVLVVAPKRIVQTVWRQEAQQWSHLRHLTFSLIQGTPVQRETALRRRAQIYLINYENLPWLKSKIEQFWLSKTLYPPFQMLVLDEITKVKNATAKRTKELLKLIPYFTRRVGLTGEPAAKGYSDLHGQFLCVDAGQRLGTSKETFKRTFLRPVGYMGYEWVATKEGRKRIHDRIHDITVEMSEEEYLDLPPVTYSNIWVDLPPKAREIYDAMEKTLFATLDSGLDLEVVNEAGKLNKLIQIASGAAYLVTGGSWEEIHRAKLEALDDVLEEAMGRPVLLGYNYVHEATRIAQAYPERPQSHSGASFLSSKLGERAMADVLSRWDRDEIPLLCGHGLSMGHGLNLQKSSARSVVWFSLPWALELYRQLNARLIGGIRRRYAPTVHHILARDTMDECVLDLLENRGKTQDGLKSAIHSYRERKGL